LGRGYLNAGYGIQNTEVRSLERRATDYTDSGALNAAPNPKANLTGNPIDSIVGYDNFEGARQVTHLLHGRGHGSIAVVTSARDANDRIEDRLKGYLTACSELGVDTHDLVLRCENSFVGGADAIDRILRGPQPIDLLLCSTDVMAVGAIFECQRRGIAVPRQLGICGFDDLPIASSINPALTTVSIDRVEMGRTGRPGFAEEARRPTAHARNR
jgi:LacI family transcriptional regulator, gluconate utilization system Gnt-I transcriptional repressor